MEIQIGDIFSLRHFSVLSHLKASFLSRNDNSLALKFEKDFQNLGITSGDPLIIGFNNNNVVYIAGGTVVSYTITDQIITINLEDVMKIDDQELFRDFPVSLTADVRLSHSNKRYSGIIKKFKYMGFVISMKDEFPVDQLLELEIFLDRVVIFLKVSIENIKETKFGYDYLVRITSIDFNTQNTLKLYMNLMKNEHESSIARFKNS